MYEPMMETIPNLPEKSWQHPAGPYERHIPY